MILKVKHPNGAEFEKVLEEITCDADAFGKQLIFEKSSTDFYSCIFDAINHYNNLDDFVNNINYYRKYVPNKQFSKYPTKVEFYK